MSSKVLAVLLLVACLAGCASSTMVITNEKKSDAVKAKGFQNYHEVLLIPPKDDPRQVVPRVVQEMTQMGFAVHVMDPSKPINASQGTGFVIGRDGWLLTCAHVVGDQTVATITISGQRVLADVVKTDTKVDLALLKLREPLAAGTPTLDFRDADRPPAMGEDVFTIGYPLSHLLGNSARMSKGLLSATAGMHDDLDHVQVSAEVQPGNSGGPLLDSKGYVIGVIDKSLNATAVAQASGGAAPQNVNFAVKNEPILKFIKAASDPAYQALEFHHAHSFEEATQAVVKVQAGRVGPDSENAKKLVVNFIYSSHWDIWYRFRYFVLTAFDYESHERLFTTGQGRDNLVSNEDIVIRDTMSQFRKALDAH